jgi:DNA phosphorothioation-associated putative methyltransferase
MFAVQRHKTALRRSELSRPIRLALAHGLINSSITFFDYGCGHGDDIRRLNHLGVNATGWDPVHSPKPQRQPADVVNLGYVVNVIENPTERANVLRDAWSFTNRLLVVSARLTIEMKDGIRLQGYSDGYLTHRGTFQKFYDQRELGNWIDEVLGLQSVAIGPGVFYVFRDNDLKESFTASRYRRTITAPREKVSHLIFEQNRELFAPLIDFLTNRGRLPDDSELTCAGEIRDRVGSLQRAFGIIRKVTGVEHWDRICCERAEDLLVYLALSRFGGRPKLSALPFDLQLDVRGFFGNYRRASGLADQLLFSAGNQEAIRDACQKSMIGKRLPDALYVHTSAISSLPSVLRVYEGCARAYIGNIEGATVVKLSIGKPQISYLCYPDFDTQGHPALIGSLIIPLDSFHIRYRDYTDSRNPFILHRKETLVQTDHPARTKFESLTRREEKLGLYDNPELIGTKSGWEELLRLKGLRQSGHRVVRLA